VPESRKGASKLTYGNVLIAQYKKWKRVNNVPSHVHLAIRWLANDFPTSKRVEVECGLACDINKNNSKLNKNSSKYVSAEGGIPLSHTYNEANFV